VSWRERRLADGGDFCTSSDPEIHVTIDAPRSSTRPLSASVDEPTLDVTESTTRDDQGLVDEPSDIRPATRTSDNEDVPTPRVGLEIALAPFAMEDAPTVIPEGDESAKARAAEPPIEAVTEDEIAPTVPAPEPLAEIRAEPAAAAPTQPASDKPPPMMPIPVPLPLVSPPPVSEPRSAPPPQPRSLKGAAATACVVAGMAGALYFFAFGRQTHEPALAKPITAPEATAATTAVTPIARPSELVNPVTPPPNTALPVSTPPPAPEPATAPVSAAKAPARGQAPANKLCGVRTGRPCF
jgi:hypothetical protein